MSNIFSKKILSMEMNICEMYAKAQLIFLLLFLATKVRVQKECRVKERCCLSI